ncbi:hypothetical protein CC80DRAFT_449747 [Byssothecium circinans]|uniref:Uncharacterized protein n=1 Tax=Byssothecium circinans TaxID=147558 RepID=A0A6A5TQ95_9PLEO|nr:hypothetical protein CC80DRAFT_449747 [Byssothecium circinans]
MSRPKRGYKRPPSESLSESEASDIGKPQLRRGPTVYDAVAGKITQSGFLGPKAVEQRRAIQPLRPDEVLFKKANAPTRYEETDYYFAHKRLPDDQKLPDGDLLSALHSYVSKLYAWKQQPGQRRVWKCMDETALIALGILMEEMAKETLGETGDLALLEAANSEEEAILAEEAKCVELALGRKKDVQDVQRRDKDISTSGSDFSESVFSSDAEDDD